MVILRILTATNYRVFPPQKSTLTINKTRHQTPRNPFGETDELQHKIIDYWMV